MPYEVALEYYDNKVYQHYNTNMSIMIVPICFTGATIILAKCSLNRKTKFLKFKSSQLFLCYYLKCEDFLRWTSLKIYTHSTALHNEYCSVNRIQSRIKHCGKRDTSKFGRYTFVSAWKASHSLKAPQFSFYVFAKLKVTVRS